MSNFVSNENATALFTKVKNNFGTQVVEWDDWREMTPQEKEAIPEAKIINAPGIDDNGGHVNVFKKLWENPDPSSVFAAQNIILSSDDYEFMYWDVLYSSGGYHLGFIFPKGSSSILYLAATSGNTFVTNVQRDVIRTNDTKFAVSNGMRQSSGAARTTENTLLVPVAIYGFKKSIDVTAIISNASTEAKNCYLEDGVTTVGDVIDKGSVTVTGDGVKTYAQLFNELYALVDSTKTSYRTTLVRNSSGNLAVYHPISVFGNTGYFTRTTIQAAQVTQDTACISSASSFRRAVTAASSTTFSDVGTSVASNGEKLSIYY